MGMSLQYRYEVRLVESIQARLGVMAVYRLFSRKCSVERQPFHP